MISSPPKLTLPNKIEINKLLLAVFLVLKLNFTFKILAFLILHVLRSKAYTYSFCV